MMTATGFLPSRWKGEEVAHAAEWSKGIRLARSFGSVKRLSPPFRPLMAQRMTAKLRWFLSQCAINASLTIAFASNNRNSRLARARFYDERVANTLKRITESYTVTYCVDDGGRYLVTAIQNSRGNGSVKSHRCYETYRAYFKVAYFHVN